MEQGGNCKLPQPLSFHQYKYWSIFKEGSSEANILYTELIPNGSRVKFQQNVLTERFEYFKLFFLSSIFPTVRYLVLRVILGGPKLVKL